MLGTELGKRRAIGPAPSEGTELGLQREHPPARGEVAVLGNVPLGDRARVAPILGQELLALVGAHFAPVRIMSRTVGPFGRERDSSSASAHASRSAWRAPASSCAARR